jgi:two-component system sensor histidine kinase VanS
VTAEGTVPREPGLSARLRLTLSYAGFLLLAGVLLLTAVWLFLLRGSPGAVFVPDVQDFVRALDPRNFGPRAFLPAALMLLVFLVLFGLVGGWFLAGRMLAPLTLITAATRRATAGSLSHRIELEGRQDEFRELADSVDAMLARLEAQVAEQRRFAANASHELRTPLAITQTMLDVARRDPARADPKLVERLHAVNARAIDLTEALLLLSRSDQRSFAREPVDLSLLAEEAGEILLPLAEKRDVAIEASGGSAVTLGSRPLLLQLMTNLVHNAIVHNNRAEHGAVCIRTATDVDSVQLTVENTGPELDPHRVARLAEPFERGAERIRSDHAGVGLGLAIVQSITQAHDGTLLLRPRVGGGLCVTVRLPAVAAATDS